MAFPTTVSAATNPQMAAAPATPMMAYAVSDAEVRMRSLRVWVVMSLTVAHNVREIQHLDVLV